MSRYKRLECPRWFYHIERLGLDLTEELRDAHFFEITPIFQQNGWYFDRFTKSCWCEWNGKAYTKQGINQEFLHELDQQNVKHLHPDVVQAIRTLISHRMCPKPLLELLWKHQNNETLKHIYREAKKTRRAILGR